MGPGPFKLFFGNQFKCITRVKLRVFVIKFSTLGAHLTFFMNIMQKPGPDLPHDTVPGARAQVVRHLFGLHLYLAGICCENPQSTIGGLTQCKSGPNNNMMVSRSNHPSYHFSITILLHLASLAPK